MIDEDQCKEQCCLDDFLIAPSPFPSPADYLHIIPKVSDEVCEEVK